MLCGVKLPQPVTFLEHLYFRAEQTATTRASLIVCKFLTPHVNLPLHHETEPTSLTLALAT